MVSLLAVLTFATIGAAPSIPEIEAAHHATELRSHPVLKVHLELDFGGKPRIHGTLYARTDGGRTRIETDDGRVIVFDGKTAHLKTTGATDAKVLGGARLDALTWSYFLLAPFKLSDSGAQYDRTNGALPFLTVPMETAKLTFGERIGDAPDDWYVVYANPENHRVEGLAYIVTFGPKTKESAEKEPHAIVYSHYERFQGVTLATEWAFRLWSAKAGVHGPNLGAAKLSNIESLEDEGTLFQAPPGSVEAPIPLDR